MNSTNSTQVFFLSPKRGRRTNLYLYENDLDNVNTLATFAHTNDVRRTNVSLIARAAIAVLAASPSRKFLDALEQVATADQRFKVEE